MASGSGGRSTHGWGRYDLLPGHIAVFTARGRRVFANRAWREAAASGSCRFLSADGLDVFVREAAGDGGVPSSDSACVGEVGRLLARHAAGARPAATREADLSPAVDCHCACERRSGESSACRIRIGEHRVGGRTVLLAQHDEGQPFADQDLRKALADRETLLREVHHRVKNNLQVISSLLALQLRTLDSDAAREALLEMRLRVRAIAAVHERLCESQDLASLDLGEYLAGIVPGILSSFGGDGGAWDLDMHTDVVPVNLDDAVRCGLIVNELVANAIEHGFEGRPKGRVSIELRRLDESRARLVVSDDGVGLPAEIDPARAESLGLHLSAGLAQRLGSSLEVRRLGERGERGTSFSLTIRTQGTS